MSFKTAHVFISRGFLASECLTMAKLSCLSSSTRHPTSQAKACAAQAAVLFALALQTPAECYLMPAELVCCMWHLYSYSTVHFLTCLTLLCQRHPHSFQPSLSVTPSCMLTLPDVHMQAPPPPPLMSGTCQFHQVCIIWPKSMIFYCICIH